MTSILDTLAADVGAALTGDARAGTLRRGEVTGVDGYGYPVVEYSTHACRGWTEQFEASYLSAGIPSTDVRIVILAASIDTAPTQGDQVYIESRWWQVRAVQRDPAGATYAMQCFQISDPT